MKKNRLTSIITLAVTLIFALAIFAGCGPKPETPSANVTMSGASDLATGGTLLMKVNPEIAISYDKNGNVTAINARNNDAKAIIEAYDFTGKDTKTVVSELVTKIGEAGYFVEEVDGERRTITIEIESGSVLPNDVFLDDVIANVKDAVNSNNWTVPAKVFSNGKLYDDDIFDLDDIVEEIYDTDDARTCTNPYCYDDDCDDLYCDEGPLDDVRTCTNPYCYDDDCDDVICDEDDRDN